MRKLLLDFQSSVVFSLIERKHVFSDPEIILPSYDPSQDPTIDDFSAFVTPETFSVDYLCQLFHFSSSDVLNIYQLSYIGQDTGDWNFVLVVKNYKAQNTIFRRNV